MLAAAEQSRAGVRIERNALRAGDLVFFRFSGAPWFAQRYAGATRLWRD